ncbi:ankyrin repeat-containing domain protein [Aspergillus crustosus]
MSVACLRHLLAGALSTWELRRHPGIGVPFRRPNMDNAGVQRRRLQMQHSFLDYSLRYWHYHARKALSWNDDLRKAFNDFFSNGNGLFAAWVDASRRPTCAVASFTPLHVASWASLSHAFRLLITAGQDVDTLTEDLQTPHILAAKGGYADIVAVLVELGARPDLKDRRGFSALHYAAQLNSSTPVRILLETGVSPLIKKSPNTRHIMGGVSMDMPRDTPLRFASAHGFVESVCAMLPFLSTKDSEYSLRVVIDRQKSALAIFLLESVDFNIKSDLGGDLLLMAANMLNIEMMELLIAKGADPSYCEQSPLEVYAPDHREFQDRFEKGSLLLAICASASHGFRTKQSRNDPNLLSRALDLAFDAACDVNVVGKRGQTALHYCVSSDMLAIDRLLEHGADVHARDLSCNTPLHFDFLVSIHISVIESLLRYGARWDTLRKSDGKTPLHVCLEKRKEDIEISLLRPYVEEWNIPDSKGNTLLHVARGEELVVQLVDFGVDVNRKNHNGETPLHLVRDARGPGRLLVAAGADIEAKDNKGRTWFLTAVLQQALGTNRLEGILELGADFQATDFEDNNALHLAWDRQESFKAFEFLMRIGVNHLHTNHKADTLYRTILKPRAWAMTINADKIFEIILTTNIPVLARNYQWETILHYACRMPTILTWTALVAHNGCSISASAWC